MEFMEQFMHLIDRGKGVTRMMKMKIRTGKPSGFGLVELTISMALLVVVMAGVYYALMQTTQRSTRTMQASKTDFETTKALARLEQEVMNVIILRASDGAHMTTAMGNLDESDGSFIPYGLVPLPGFRVSDVQGLADLTARDSRNYFDPAHPGVSDGLRMAFYLNESISLPLAYEDAATQTYFETAQVPTEHAIILAKRDGLEVGDFAIIQDRMFSDLFRVTAIEPHPQGFAIRHDSSVSIWNLPFRRNYGELDTGPVYVREVSVVTYAHNPTTEIVYRKDHLFDDGFNPVDQTFGAPRTLSNVWMPVMERIPTFQLEYVLVNGDRTRIPAAAPYGTDPDGPLRGNELGRPRLARIGLVMTQRESTLKEERTKDDRMLTKTIEKEINPLNLLNARGEAASPDAPDNTPTHLNPHTPTPEDDGDGDDGDDGSSSSSSSSGGNDFGPPGSGGSGL